MSRSKRGNGEYRTLWLSDKNWAKLERLAVELDAMPTTGKIPLGGRAPSWHTLIRLVAIGKIGLHRVGEVVKPSQATALIRWAIEHLHKLKPVSVELRPLKRRIMAALRAGEVPDEA